MKRLLYLLPLALIVLSLAGISLHKDTVSYKPGGDLQSLTPSHWKMKDYNLNASVDLSQASGDTSAATKAYSDGAKFYGFPFGAYFSNDQHYSSSSLSVSAYSWLWSAVDVLLVVATLLLAILLNRPNKQVPMAQPPADTTPMTNPPVSPNDIYPTLNT